jgi:hypothetical protein
MSSVSGTRKPPVNILQAAAAASFRLIMGG